MEDARFVVEHAGCPSCAVRIRTALEAIAPVRSIAIDETNDVATVLVEAGDDGGLSDAVDAALKRASRGANHTYVVRAGSWGAAA